MIPKECKRLAEVDFPIALVSKHAVQEKSIRHGVPSTIHLWWARRPLAACRAMLLGLLLPDPEDEHCPKEFITKARELLRWLPGNVGPTNEDLRRGLLQFIGNFAAWNLSSDRPFLEVAHGLVKAAQFDETLLVVDSFAGGGSIPLEALRLGCEVFASDLNPVACLILKVMLEDIPRHGSELVDEFEHLGIEINKAVQKELADFYPSDPDGAQPIAYVWARTVRCESPNCGAEIPLIRSFWLCKKSNRRLALKYRIVRPTGKPPYMDFELFQPKSESEVSVGTVSRAKATCLCCNAVLPPDRVRLQLRDQHGGADVIYDGSAKRVGGARILAVVILRTHEQGRHYRLPHDQDYQAVWKAMKQLEKGSFHNLPGSFSPIPDEPTPTGGGSGAGRAFSLRKYGMTSWADLFTARQKLALATLTEKFRHFKTNAPIQGIAALALSKFTELATANCPWEPLAECPRKIFNLQAIPTRWEFAEGVITSNSSGGVQVVIQNVISTLNAIASNWNIDQSGIADACALPIPDTISDVWFIDPPYYDAVPYSDLSGFFFVWLKRILPGHQLLCDPFDSTNPLTPKLREIIQDELKLVDNRPKDKSFFEKEMSRDFTEGRRILKDNGITCVVFAHKTTEGWEALLSGMIQAKWVITASWPIATEQQHRPRARNSAALATSIHLVCRPRPEDAPIGDWGNVLRELPRRVSYWMERLQEERVRGADLVFACIGPALEIFSRYSKVETAEGCEVTLAEYLEKVWEVVGRSALEQVLGTAEAQARNGIAGALEEDARLTALFLWTLQSTNGSLADVVSTDPSEEELDEDEDEEEEETTPRKPKGYTLIFDVVRRFAQPLGIHLPAWENRIIQTKKGVVRLLSVSDRAQQLFGRGGAHLLADQLESSPSLSDSPQLALFPEELVQPKKSRRGRKQIGLDMPDEPSQISREATTLDRVHAAMLLQANGRTNALRTLLNAEQDRGPDFLRLANALSALYAVGTEEKRLLDAMLLAVPR